jgi:prolyl-tRNA editing enzyme YbaK/EbsC (Cys-tRNA(Pro) deacylase)
MDVSSRVIAHLDRLEADYTVIEIDPELADTASFCEHYGYGLDESANAIVVASRRPQGHYAVCLALATTRLDVNHRVRSLMGVSKLSFADAGTTRELTGMEIGGVTPFGLPPELPILVDRRVMGLERCIVGGGSRSIKISVDPEVLTRIPEVSVEDDLAAPR